MAYAGIGIDDKKMQSIKCLEEGTLIALRNRAQLLLQTFSISRAAEGQSWGFCDLWMYKYDERLPGMGPMPMVVFYLVQCFDKTRTVSIQFIQIVNQIMIYFMFNCLNFRLSRYASVCFIRLGDETN